MCEKVAVQARAKGVAGQVVILKLKTSDFKLLSRRRSLSLPAQTAATLFRTTRQLLATEIDGRAFRLVGVGLLHLTDVETAMTDLFTGAESKARLTESTMDRVRARFGATALVSGRSLKVRQ